MDQSVYNNKLAASLTERDNRLAHYFGHFGFWGYFCGILLLPVQNVTSHSCSATLMSYECDKISRLSCLVFDI